MHKLGDYFAKQVNLQEIFSNTNMYLKTSTQPQLLGEKCKDEAVDHEADPFSRTMSEN